MIFVFGWLILGVLIGIFDGWSFYTDIKQGTFWHDAKWFIIFMYCFITFDAVFWPARLIIVAWHKRANT
jgi:hypothetical protein